MKTFILAALLMACGVTVAGDRVTGVTRNFGRGTLTLRSDGSRMISGKFGSRTLHRETFRSGRTSTSQTFKFGRGSMTVSKGAYVRKP